MALPTKKKVSGGQKKQKSRKGSGGSRVVAAPSTKRLSATSLPWKTIKNTASFAGIDEGGGMMMLEELDDVGVEWEEEGGARIARFVTSGASKANGKGKEKALQPEEDESVAGEDEGDEWDEEEEWKGIVDEPVASAGAASDSEEEDADAVSVLSEEHDSETGEDEAEVPAEDPFNDDLLPEWKGSNLHSSLKRAVLALGFVNPTDIQRRAMPGGTSGRDVIGIAETGSGKTLAYSLPILSYLLRTSPTPSGKGQRRPLSGLVLCPTRELALQVVDHLQKVAKHALDGEQSGPPRISIGSVVGGLSAQKQKRIVERGCDILVATPGRLWDLIKTDEELARGVRRLRFLVIDEADRMIENGHFAELESIVRLTQRTDNRTAGPDDDDPIFSSTSSLFSESSPREDMQTFVFSATLSKDLQHNLKKRYRPTGKKSGKKTSALEDLVERLDFRDENPEVIDLSPEGGVVKQLKESMIECVVADKDLYLYYFLLRYPGRSLVFVGSIDGIRRLVPLFETLQMPIYPLHSQLQQKQRLKNLDRFKSSSNGVLIATDVAARGLDIPNVEHVVHFNLPRTADAYVHRSGRTARAQNPGFALQLCAPEEKGMQRALMKSLGRDAELPDLPIEAGFLPKLRERITLAREIEKAQHQVKKDNHDRNWLKETAEAMDLDIDPDMLSDQDDDPDAPYHRRKKTKGDPKAKKRNVPALKEQLRTLLVEPLMARGVSAKYPTSGSKVIVNDLVNATGHGTMLGASTVKAYDEVHKARVKVPKIVKRKRQA